MTDLQLDHCRAIHWLEQGHAKLLGALWRSAKRGTRVRCLDDRLGAHFLVRGKVYTVDQMQRDTETNGWRVCLVGRETVTDQSDPLLFPDSPVSFFLNAPLLRLPSLAVLAAMLPDQVPLIVRDVSAGAVQRPDISPRVAFEVSELGIDAKL
jgi:hypothetical protein